MRLRLRPKRSKRMFPSLLPSRIPFIVHKYMPISWKRAVFPIKQHHQFRLQTSLPTPTSWQGESVEKDSPATKESLIDSLLTSTVAFSTQGQLSHAFRTYCLLQFHVCGGSSSSNTTLHLLQPISSLLLSCISLKSLPQGKQLHAQIIFLGFRQDPLLVTKLVSFYTAFGILTDAHSIAADSSARHAVPWNVLISTYVRLGLSCEALPAFRQMVDKGIKPDNYTYPSVLKACGDELELDFGREIHKSIYTSGLEWCLFVHNALVSMYAKCGSVGEARNLFDKMPERDVISWNAMISGYACKGMWKEAFELFERMRMGDSQVNSVTWNTIAGGNLQIGNYREALELVSQMRFRGVCLDSVTLIIGLGACSRLKLIKLGKEIHGSAVRGFCDATDSVRNALITMYFRCKDLKHAYILFLMAETKDVITWNCMVAGYAHLDRYEEASFMFREMVSSGVVPNYVTIASILPLCARIANLQHGKEMHCYVLKRRFEEYLLIWNSLVDMYSKSSRVFHAQRVFDTMKQRDEVSYTSLIAGYGMQGEGQAALELFDEMNRCRIKPDHIAMVAVLSACSHAGLVAQGQLLFEKMVSVHGLVPKMEHFACMVDLYGRAGLLRKAEEIIGRMPFRPSPAMWGTLLGACRIHGNMEIGECAAEKLLEMKPDNPGYYVLIANMYAAVGRWNSLAEVRTLMRDLGLKKDPGCAWVDVGSGFQPFLVDDWSSSQSQEIYLLLDGLVLLMREVHHVANEDLELEADI